jgi:proline racemase/trans-L-3-hydroxyproline dehydratase
LDVDPLTRDPGNWPRRPSPWFDRAVGDPDAQSRSEVARIVIEPGQVVRTTDYHTGGEPFRIVTGGVAVPAGRSVLDRRGDAISRFDDVRAFLVNEPRGHADMYGCFVTPPDDDGAVIGAIFFHKDGFSTACGHGTIALATWAVHEGLVASARSFAIDVPSGRLAVEVEVLDGEVTGASFVNVASFVSATDLELSAGGRDVRVDVSFGGAFYASVDVGALGLSVTPEHLGELIAIGRGVRAALAGHEAVRHPSEPRLSGCYGTIFHETLEARGRGLAQRNVTVFADGEVDRSPCGSGTSARLAVLHHRGALGTGDLLDHTSIVGSTFAATVIDTTTIHGRPAVITRVAGRAHRTGRHEFVLDVDDELGLGFQLR